ncbi:SDR family oxidoreductase [Candidatus Saccharibacteria bacterium]|nr:SDR family oxidoreductase [Candidatus Saccharibacteria bacterium]
MKLPSKTILITGASDGIGRSIAIKLAKEKAKLILFGRDQTKLNEVQKLCEENGAQEVQTFAFDINDNEKRRAVAEEILEQNQIDILINNAGVWQKTGGLTTLDEETITEVINTDLTSQILLTRQLLGHMKNRQDTAIINVISKSGVVAQAGQSVYTAAKYGMRGFTDVLRLDTKDDPIQIAGVYQSGTNTDMFRKSDDIFPTDSFTEPDDLADVVVFILSRPSKIWLNEVRVEK